MYGRRSAALVTALFITGVVGACANKPTTPPSKQVRTDLYAQVMAGARTNYVPMMVGVMAEDAVTVWDSTSAAGVDMIVKNWQSILVGAKVDQVTRTIRIATSIGDRVIRDSGTIAFRLRDSTQKLGFRDTTMAFITYWAFKPKDKGWRIEVDSVRGDK
jgi:hypothetical protein